MAKLLVLLVLPLLIAFVAGDCTNRDTACCREAKFKTFIKCTAAGHYEAKQCFRRRCSCVNPTDGIRLGAYSVRDAGLIAVMDCKCALKELADGKTYDCDTNGNFRGQTAPPTSPPIITIPVITTLGPITTTFRPPGKTKCELKKETPDGRNLCCELNGEFCAKQCSFPLCLCVHPDTGNLIKMYYSADSGVKATMTCACAVNELKHPGAHACQSNGNFQQSVTPCDKNSKSCGHNGIYNIVQCTQSGCTCVDEVTGVRIGSYSAQSRGRMDCKCAIAKQHGKTSTTCAGNGNFPNGGGDGGGGTCLQAFRLKGAKVHCDKDGNYRAKQCDANSCYCVNMKTGAKTGHTGTKTEHMDCLCASGNPKIIQTSCANNGNYPKTCANDRLIALDMLKKDPHAFAYETKCEFDGSYKAVQCFRDVCWCVNKQSGKQIASFEANKGTTQYSSINCQCARASQTSGSVTCERNGNYKTVTRCVDARYRNSNVECIDNNTYKPKQCNQGRTSCYCADKKSGEKISTYVANNPHYIAAMDCQCATDEHFYMKKDDILRVSCNDLGNYRDCKETDWQISLHPKHPAFNKLKLNCKADGSFNYKQCYTDKCFCVNERGHSLTHRVPKHQAAKMNCLCAVARDKAFRTGQVSNAQSIHCDQIGNYYQQG